ncbi:MAG: hypothetical protein H7Z72_04915 [Bacteroidetes bacterium]|nr:hypothetical protein [Fibrella sp.]
MIRIDRLTEKVADLQKARQQIDAHRNQWKTITRPFLLDQLTLVKEAFPIGWSLTHSDSAWTNLDQVALSFDNTDSGIVAIETNQPVVKQGGGLVFGQFVNGKIVVMIVYPAIKDFARPSVPKQIGAFDPDEIDAEFVTRVLIQFLEEMAEWEENGERSLPQIGFDH